MGLLYAKHKLCKFDTKFIKIIFNIYEYYQIINKLNLIGNLKKSRSDPLFTSSFGS